VTNKIFTLASEIRYLCSKWQTLSIYERFEQTVVTVLTLVEAAGVCGFERAARFTGRLS
jgi:hypothetical protein